MENFIFCPALITNNSDEYDEKYIKIKFNWDDNLPLNKMLELRSEGNKYDRQVFLDECLYKL